MKKLLLVITILISSFIFGYTQDIIHFKTGRRIKAKVIHIQNDTVYYMRYNRKKVQGVNREKISVIFMENGMKLIQKNKKTREIVKQEKKEVAVDKKKRKKKVHKLLAQLHTVKKPFGLGVDIMLNDRRPSFTGLSLDIFIIKNLNAGIGYGYFFGKPAVYLNGKLILNEIKNNWYPICDLTVTKLKNAAEIQDDLEIKKYSNHFNIYIPSIGIEYMDNSGFTFDLKLGASLLKGASSKFFFDSLALSIRVSGHI